MFAEKYFDNIRLNASFGRYFEPAPKRKYYGGFGLRYNFDWDSVGLRNNSQLQSLPALAKVARVDVQDQARMGFKSAP